MYSIKASLPKNKIKDFNLALEAIKIKFGNIIAVKKLKGLSNYNFLIECLKNTLVLKILNLNPVTNNANESLINKELNNLKICPNILIDNFPKYYVIEYIRGKNATAVYFNNDNNLDQLFMLLKKLHNTKHSISNNTINFIETNSNLINNIPSSKYTAILNEKLQLMEITLKKLPQNLAFCHNDLNKENLILDQSNKLWLIDFEYSGISDIFFDLTSLKSILSPKQYKKLLNRYNIELLPHLHEHDFNNKLKIFNLLLLLTGNIWYLYMSKNNKSNYNKYYNSMFGKLHIQLNCEFNKYFNNI